MPRKTQPMLAKDLDNEFGFVMYLGNNLVGDEREKAIVNMRWMLNCFLCAIIDSYSVGAPRREQACNMVENFGRKIYRQLSQDEWEKFCKGMINPDTGKVMCRSVR